MPDVAVHLCFGEEVARSLSADIQKKLSKDPYDFALLGPDIWFMYKPWIRRNGRGRRMHTTRTGEFLSRLADEALKSGDPVPLFSYLAGFICHYALDSTAHPYVIRLSTTEYPLPGAHRGLEHALDVLELQRAGVWGERHPMTKHAFRAIRLPREIGPALDAAYRQTYGWENSRRILNRSYRLFRFLYSLMENPKGLGARLAKLTRSPFLREMIYSASDFIGMDAENLEHRPWAHSHDDSIVYTDSFPELREQARQKAVRIIQAAYDYVFLHSITKADLEAQIGSDSYLSGLPMGDPRSLTVPSMMPPEDQA